MPRIKDVLRDINLLPNNPLEPTPTNEMLYGRFVHIRHAIAAAFIAKNNPSLLRELSHVDWGGADDGIEDYHIYIQGCVGGVYLNITFKGSRADSLRFDIAPGGDWYMENQPNTYGKIDGRFLTRDNGGDTFREGAVEITTNNGNVIFEAYWLQTGEGRLRLEQVVDKEGNTYNADFLLQVPDGILIPGVNHVVSRYKTPQLNAQNRT